MATRGVNGATAASLNERFIKCAGCKVNIPKDDMLALGKCTVCGRVYEAEPVGDAVIIETVAFAADSEASSTAASAAVSAAVSDKPVEKPKRKRWVTLTSKRGRTYYHNTETGEDTWEKPPDFDADAAADDGFVPFKHDAVKNAVLREQAKMDATKMGLPAEVIATMQQRQAEAQGEDPLDSMLKRPTQRASAVASLPQQRMNASHNSASSHFNGSNAHQNQSDEEDEDDNDDQADGSVASTARMDGTNSPKQGSCILIKGFWMIYALTKAFNGIMQLVLCVTFVEPHGIVQQCGFCGSVIRLIRSIRQLLSAAACGSAMRRQECPLTAHSSIRTPPLTRPRTRRVATMRVMSFSLQIALLVLLVVILSPFSLASAATSQCPEDAKLCEAGRVVHRDPQRNCEFPACSSANGSHSQSHAGSGVTEVVGCEEDALACPNGDIISRDPKLDCEFPACPQGGSASTGTGSGVLFLQERNFPTPSVATPEPSPSVSSSASKLSAVVTTPVIAMTMAGVLYGNL